MSSLISIKVLTVICFASIGSFFTMLTHRLPKMRQKREKGFNLCTPASHCPQCNTPLKWYHNIPLVSYLGLRGQCGYCHHPIPLRYFLIELAFTLIGLLIIIVYP